MLEDRLIVIIMEKTNWKENKKLKDKNVFKNMVS